MKRTHYSEINPVHMDNDIAKGVSGRVAIGKADGADHFCMRVFELAKSGYSPRHSTTGNTKYLFLKETARYSATENGIRYHRDTPC